MKHIALISKFSGETDSIPSCIFALPSQNRSYCGRGVLQHPISKYIVVQLVHENLEITFLLTKLSLLHARMELDIVIPSA